MLDEGINRNICWDELSAEEVLALLRQTAEQHGGAVSGFLDTHQWVPLAEQPGLILNGGHPQAQFRRAGINLERLPVAIYRLPAGALPDNVHTPRQLRGWLYRNAAPDSSIGDISAAGDLTLAADPALPLAIPELALVELSGWSAELPKLQRSTAASSRADAVVSTVFNVSRGEAQTAIKHGFVFVNFQPLAKRTQTLVPGQQLVFRTKGRALLAASALNPRSGRVWVEYYFFPC